MQIWRSVTVTTTASSVATGPLPGITSARSTDREPTGKGINGTEKGVELRYQYHLHFSSRRPRWKETQDIQTCSLECRPGYQRQGLSPTGLHDILGPQ